MSNAVNVAILGGSGFGAGELMRLLVHHPNVNLISVTTTSRVGKTIGDVHPHLRGFYDLQMSDQVDLGGLLDADAAVVFSALPHGASAIAIDRLLDEAAQHDNGVALRVVDLSGDLRLKDTLLHERYYPETPWLPEYRASFAYGLPELFREDIRAAHYIANPGCLATAAILATAPLSSVGISGHCAIDAKTGSSGSGRQLKETTHHATRRANYRAYKPLGHRHEPEILQALGDSRGERIRLSFVPQSMDTTRGIYVTAHLELPEEADSDRITQTYETFYADAPFVRVLSDPPELQNVVVSNFCDVSVAVRGRQIAAMAALDNLGKGMSGTAIQNMNLMCGLPETTGLWSPSARPL